MTEEVAHVVLRRAGLKQARGELAPEVMELQVRDAGTALGRPPGRIDAEHPLSDLCAKHERVGSQRLASRVCGAHLELRPQPTAYGDDACLIGLRTVCGEHQPSDLSLVVPTHLTPLQAEQLADAATGAEGGDDQRAQMGLRLGEQPLFLPGLEAAMPRRLGPHVEPDHGHAVTLEGRGLKVSSRISRSVLVIGAS